MHAKNNNEMRTAYAQLHSRHGHAHTGICLCVCGGFLAIRRRRGRRTPVVGACLNAVLHGHSIT